MCRNGCGASWPSIRQSRVRGRSMAEVRFQQATRIYPGTDNPALEALDLQVEDGELVVLVGPSGSGKTTALRMLAGLEEVDGGAVYIGDRDVSDDTPKSRDVAMVFQNYALYPYLSVADNIGFPLRVAKVPKAERAQRVREVAVLRDARLQQCDTPRVLFDRPANTFVAGFIGSPAMNLCTLPVTDGKVAFGSMTIDAVNGRDRLVLGVRPEALELASDGLDARV